MLPEQRKQYKILVMSHSTKLPGDLKGLDRESYMARILAKAGYQVVLVTSDFQHWEKQKRQVKTVPSTTNLLKSPASTNLVISRTWILSG